MQILKVIEMQEAASTIEMYVASAEELHDDGTESPPKLRRSISMHVPPPRSAPPQKVAVASNEELSKTDSQNTELRSMKNELGMMTAELREAALDLKDSQRNLR